MPKDADKIYIGAGGCFTAPIGTAVPDDIVDPIAPWAHVGFTETGFRVRYSTETLDVMADQSFDPVKSVVTGRIITIATTLLQITPENLALAFGGGTITPESGYDTYVPPAPGEETEVMLYFKLVNEIDGPVRAIIRRAKRQGDSEITFARTEAAKITAEWKALDPGLSADPTPIQLDPIEFRIADGI
jgi:hypothetical protein